MIKKYLAEIALCPSAIGMRYKLTKNKLEAILAALSYYIDELEEEGVYKREIREANKAFSWALQELRRRTHVSQ